MIGLKTYLSTLSPLLGQSEEMLYERQRALVRQGLLESIGGRGPGSGVRADEKSLSIFLISLLTHDLLVLAYVTEIFCGMKHEEGKCPVTGARTFQQAMQRVLGDQKLAESVIAPAVRVDRSNHGSGYLFFKVKTGSSTVVPPSTSSAPRTTGGRLISSTFRNKGQPPLPPSAIDVSTSLKAELIRRIANDIDQFKKDGAS
jgi:hypothetical protein